MTERTTLPFAAETSKVLKLMIHSLYTNKDIFLRELVSNASDACDKLRYQAITQPELLEGTGDYTITITIDKKSRTLDVRDNGIGMNSEEMIANLGTIARSGTQEFAERMTQDTTSGAAMIGQFGVGFYSAFMVADKVTVDSRKAGDAQGHRWISDGEGEFSIEPSSATLTRGTSITLHLREGEDIYLDRFRLEHIVRTYSDHIAFPIDIVDDEGVVHRANRGLALWARPKNEITQEQYNEFYRQLAHLPGEPWAVIHNKAEGKLEYTSLLYIPTKRPRDLFNPERKRSVKLYVKRVFITDEGIELIPHYLRFLRGIIDSEDLPLNISRETLQKNPLLDSIRESVEKRVLAELKKKATKDAGGYAGFWNEFGAVLKEGLCEAIAPKQEILECSRFHSMKLGEELIGLDAYIEQMQPDQEFIYYLIADSLESGKNSAQLEGFRKREIDVLLLTDHVDDFWVNVVQEYKGKKFRSVTRAGDELKKDEKDTAEDSRSTSFIEYLKTLLVDQVKDVRTSHKLDESPVCLTVDEMGMDMRMERFLVENQQIETRSKKILEVNMQHPVIMTLREKYTKDEKNPDVESAAFLLLDQARIQEGETLENTHAFSKRFSEILKKALA